MISVVSNINVALIKNEWDMRLYTPTYLFAEILYVAWLCLHLVDRYLHYQLSHYPVLYQQWWLGTEVK